MDDSEIKKDAKYNASAEISIVAIAMRNRLFFCAAFMKNFPLFIGVAGACYAAYAWDSAQQIPLWLEIASAFALCALWSILFIADWRNFRKAS